MLQEPYVVVFLIVGLLAFIAMRVLLDLDRRYQREARWARDWERHSDRFLQSRLRLDKIGDEAGFFGEGLAQMREHDLENERFCSRQAELCRSRIPKRLRRHYHAA